MVHTTQTIVPPAAAEGPLALPSPWRHLLFPRRLRALYSRWQGQPQVPVWRAMLDDLAVTYDVTYAARGHIPLTGATVVVANHPYGILDGGVVLDALLAVRRDVRVLTNHLLASVPELRQVCIPIDPYERGRHGAANRAGMRRALRWLQEGGLLVVFPAGEVASCKLDLTVRDPAWKSTAARLIARSGANAVPLHVSGRNSLMFQLSALVHPALRTLRLPRELLNKHGAHVHVVVGEVVRGAELAAMDALGATRLLRARTDALSHRLRKPSQPATRPLPEPLAAPLPVPVVTAELRAVAPETRLYADDQYDVFLVTAQQAPNTLLEVGRLREATFRAAGEGTGLARDRDAFDTYYKHLVLWHRASEQVAGGYRLARTDTVMRERGVAGLYTYTCFDYDARLFKALHTDGAWELGRSFVIQEHQRSYGALLGLWKALARLMVAPGNPPWLMGGVSISNAYTPLSRALIARYLRTHHFNAPLAAFVRGRTPFASRDAKLVTTLLASVADLDALSRLVAQVEPDNKGIPVLLRQYLRLGGEVIAFHVDKDFGHTLDAMVLVDLRQTPPRVLQRYTR